MSALCLHLYVIDKTFSPELLAEKKESTCSWCQANGPNLWLCLYRGCLKIGCGESGSNHSLAHNNHLSSHCIAINLSNLKAWCYMCEMEVTSWVLCKLRVNPSQQPHFGSQINAPGIAVARPDTPNDSSGEEEGEESRFPHNEDAKPRGLVGLRNLGLTCYMNAALQALSNSVPLCQFLKDCPSFQYWERKQPGVVRPFHRLILEIWHQKRPPYIAPSLLYHSFRTLYPMFRLYTQQDSQEFLRYFMDQLHEELREPYFPLVDGMSHDEGGNEANGCWNLEKEDKETEFLSMDNISDREDSEASVPSEGEDYETCDSGVSDQTTPSQDSHFSNASLQHKAKRKKKHHNLLYDTNKWVLCGRGGNMEPEQSEFSDAMSDTSLLDSNVGIRRMEALSNADPLKGSQSSATSGIGSRKSVSSLHSKMSLSSQGNTGSRTTCAPKANIKFSMGRKRKPLRYRSIISECFDGVLISSVQCLTCNTTSSRKETFQDLSLPIPSSDQLNLLHQHSPQQQKPHTAMSGGQNSSFNIYLSKNACDVTSEGWMWLWIWSIWGWVRSWLWGPSVSLNNCLAAFFSADELKGDNMYSCEKCGKLRNGIKYSKVIQLPEILIIHLKRFRHEYMFSSKISQCVSFPMHGLDLSPFLHKDCTSEVRTYDLYSVICHHGAVGSGHYTAFAQNASNGRWYEFDDQCVSEVNPETVANCEAYVLFYKKTSPEMSSRRQRTIELLQVSSHEPSLMQFYVSKQWINKFNTFSEPGPIDNSDFLCPHGGVQPLKASYVSDLVMVFSQGVWEYLHQVFGGGPACTSLYECVTCREELEILLHRQKLEHETFIQLHNLFQEEEHPEVVYAISMKWFRTWEAFVLGKQPEPPGPLDNSAICMNKYGQTVLKPGSDYAPISKQMWNFFFDIYGGGPELFVRYGRPQSPAQQQQQPVRRESYDARSSASAAMKERVGPQPERTLPFGLKSLSTDDLPYCVVFNQQPSALNRQRTVSASEVISSSSQSPQTTSGDTRVSCSSEEEEEEEASESGETRKVIRWTDVEKDEEEEEENGGQLHKPEKETRSSGSITSTSSSTSIGDEAVHKVQPSNISRPSTRSYSKSVKN